MDHNTTREQETFRHTIRARVMEGSIWRQGQRIVRGTQSKGSENVGITGGARKHAKLCKGLRNRVAEARFDISAGIMSAKME